MEKKITPEEMADLEALYQAIEAGEVKAPGTSEADWIQQ
jgi:hypothetical protein